MNLVVLIAGPVSDLLAAQFPDTHHDYYTERDQAHVRCVSQNRYCMVFTYVNHILGSNKSCIVASARVSFSISAHRSQITEQSPELDLSKARWLA